MNYNHDTVSEIVKKYLLLRGCLEILRDVKKDQGGAVLGWVAEHYEKAREADEFLKKIPSELQERLEIGKLEKELGEFANTHIHL
jgi:hypothetical protein